MRSFRFYFLAVVLTLTGCVSEPLMGKVHDPVLMVAQNSDGETTLTWDSESGYIYTIYYMNPPDGEWTKLRRATLIRGTGQMLTAKDRINPHRPLRRYRLEFEKKDY